MNHSQEVELNITPIIDCFTVLITFMLASASFITIGFLEAATPGNSDAPPITPETEAYFKLGPNHQIEVKVKGKLSLNTKITFSTEAKNEDLKSMMSKLREPSIHLNQILLTAQDTVPYSDVAEVMDQLSQADLPVVLGDF